jgi:fatty acid-binding protein DegV
MELLENEVFVLHLNSESSSLQAMAPINSDEHEELCKLEERGLAKFLVVDTSSSYLLHMINKAP